MFSPDDEFAMLITWTCYGTWLPGDRRGYVSNTRRDDGKYQPKHNIPSTAFTRDHIQTREHAATIQKFATASLDGTTAHIAAESLVNACAIRRWHIIRAALMWNHIHVVIANCPDNGPEVRRILKGVSQNGLNTHAGKPRRWWTAGGSDRYLHGEQAILSATHYVANQHGIHAQIIDMFVSERRGLSPP